MRRTIPGPGESLAETHQAAVLDVAGWDPRRYRANFREELAWKCHSCDHEWSASPKAYTKAVIPCAACREQHAHLPEPGNSIAGTPFAAEADEWDPSRIAQGSNRKLPWKWTRGHTWNAKPINRTRHSQQCPECRRLPPAGTSLAETHRDIATQIIGVDPRRYSAGSSKRCMWHDPSCGHTWGPIAISTRTRGAGCGVCAGKTVVPGVNDLASIAPSLAAEAHGWDPGTVHPGSKKNRTWKCSTCPRVWDTAPAWRMRGSGCSSCAERGFQVTKRGYLYMITDSAATLDADLPVTPQEGSYLKIGITNDLAARLGTHAGTGLRTVLDIRAHDDGAAILELERCLKAAAAKHGWATAKEAGHPAFDGYTETFTVTSAIASAITGAVNASVSEALATPPHWEIPRLAAALEVEHITYWPSQATPTPSAATTSTATTGARPTAAVPTATQRARVTLGQFEHVPLAPRLLHRRNPRRGKARLTGSEPVGLRPGPFSAPGEDPRLPWSAGRSALDDFIAHHEHALVPVDHVQDGFPLGRWVLKQRQAFRRDKLSDDQVRDLAGLPHWAWNVHDAAWWTAFRALRAAIEKTNSAKLPGNHTIDGINLSNWCSMQRRKHRDGKMPQDRTEALSKLPGWSWTMRPSTPRQH
ncbi:Helicase associated domain protein [Kineococcus indalonis]|uniref:Helicase associated domain protein n=1 Tax=Kineococcus indalonis TaxID=2696566 RepID=UPI001F0D7F41|nr:Helicase associated domain protein [Kineococcus indalonis]